MLFSLNEEKKAVHPWKPKSHFFRIGSWFSPLYLILNSIRSVFQFIHAILMLLYLLLNIFILLSRLYWLFFLVTIFYTRFYIYVYCVYLLFTFRYLFNYFWYIVYMCDVCNRFLYIASINWNWGYFTRICYNFDIKDYNEWF